MSRGFIGSLTMKGHRQPKATTRQSGPLENEARQNGANGGASGAVHSAANHVWPLGEGEGEGRRERESARRSVFLPVG